MVIKNIWYDILVLINNKIPLFMSPDIDLSYLLNVYMYLITYKSMKSNMNSFEMVSKF